MLTPSTTMTKKKSKKPTKTQSQPLVATTPYFIAGLVTVAILFLGWGGTHLLSQMRQTAHLEATYAASPTPLPSPTPRSFPTSDGKRPQFVVFSFDGSKSQEMWESTRAFAQQMNAEKKPIHFTYFISGVYFTTDTDAKVYTPPGHVPGHSDIGFADSVEDIALRVKNINGALAEGHEIGSHANGHFDGTHWTRQEWNQEFDQFNSLIFNWKKRYASQAGNAEDLHITAKHVTGFRAPLLAHNDAMFEVLAAHNYRYDSSSEIDPNLPTQLPKGWPVKEQHGIWLIPLSNVPLAGTRSTILAMDYNFFVTQTGGRDYAGRGTALWQRLHDQMYNSYLGYFNNSYAGERAPLIIGHHFSTWNSGVYWQAMQDVAREVCGKPDVYCVTFQELVQYLDTTSQ
jgi:hypothetical protein